MGEKLVWYAAYGSNIDSRRFHTYLTGGRVPHTADVQAGSSDPSPPRRIEAFRFERAIRFAHHSPRWNGATAVLDHDTAGDHGALGRRYLITEAQFEDLVAQENRREVLPLPFSDLAVDRIHPVSERAYDGLLLLEADGRTPTITFTSPNEPRFLEPTAPSAAYLGTMARGIRSAHGLTPRAVAERLHRAPGVAAAWTLDSIEDLLWISGPP